MNNKLRIAIIGCTKSTENLINELIKNKDINLLGLITLDESLAYKKARFVNLESKTSILEWCGTSTLAKWDIVFTKLLPFPTTL